MVKEYYKKIDKSFFDGRITIPKDYVDYFENLTSIGNRTSNKIKIKYTGKLCFVHQKSNRLVLQIAYYNDFCKILKQDFIQTFFAIESQKLIKEDKKFKTSLLGGNQEIIKIEVKNKELIEFSPFVQINTPYDNLFRKFVELNFFGFLSNENQKDSFIIKNSNWIDIENLCEHVDVNYVVYYLLDEKIKNYILEVLRN